MNSKRYIREGRFGLPKSFKTGAVVGTYPKPMLVFCYDVGGLDVIPSSPIVNKPNRIDIPICQDDIKTIKPTEFNEYLKPDTDLPPVLCIDFTGLNENQITLSYKPVGEMQSFEQFTDCVNQVVMMGEDCPWKTVVTDQLTGLGGSIVQHMAAVDGDAMKDARKWAGQTGGKIHQIIKVINQIKAHTVYLMHAAAEEDSETKEIRMLPMIHSKFRQQVGACLSQFFYSDFDEMVGLPVVLTQNDGFVKGIGVRWPHDLEPKCGPDFTSIYGREADLID